jgi:hypothetical protein
MADPTGESDGGALRLDFDRRLLLRFRGIVNLTPIGTSSRNLPPREVARCEIPVREVRVGSQGSRMRRVVR